MIMVPVASNLLLAQIPLSSTHENPLNAYHSGRSKFDSIVKLKPPNTF